MVSFSVQEVSATGAFRQVGFHFLFKKFPPQVLSGRLLLHCCKASKFSTASSSTTLFYSICFQLGRISCSVQCFAVKLPSSAPVLHLQRYSIPYAFNWAE
ncbi:hypothetical protein PIB30_046662 [Stylosanthes scabra]|uniref:Uncharacterized protein n=1 Tax=Stylosanthes scabra TaxID=79078 RepID=A0ABU6RH39_9FABA|nr:hypothetical protein [Stylosanthes scabra]